MVSGKENHCQIIDEYNNLPLEQRKDIYKIFSDSVDFEEIKKHQTILKSKRKLSQEQVFMIYVNEEYKILPKQALCKMFGVASNTIYTILHKKSYQDYWLDYQKITNEQKEKLVSLLRNQ